MVFHVETAALQLPPRAHAIRNPLFSLSWGVCCLAIGLGFGFRAFAMVPEKPDFNKHVRPILAGSCFRCHGSDEKLRKGKLRLDLREAALEKKAIVPGDADASELIKRILTTDEEDVMPPAKEHRALTADQKEILRRWITAGAEYQKHWAFIPPVKAPVP